VLCAIVIIASQPPGALAQSRRSDAGIDTADGILSPKHPDKATLPEEEKPSAPRHRRTIKNSDGVGHYEADVPNGLLACKIAAGKIYCQGAAGAGRPTATAFVGPETA